jgi:hypothetical protein
MYLIFIRMWAVLLLLQWFNLVASVADQTLRVRLSLMLPRMMGWLS